MIGNAVKGMRIVTGEEEFEKEPHKDEAAATMGKRGGTARAQAMTPERRAEMVEAAAPKPGKCGPSKKRVAS